MSFDSPEQNAAFAQKFGFPYALLTDADHSIAVAYGAADDRSARSPRRVGVLVDPEGRVAEWHAKVDAGLFPSQALAAIQG